jgi:hypothetical protein
MTLRAKRKKLITPIIKRQFLTTLRTLRMVVFASVQNFERMMTINFAFLLAVFMP